jgi:murein L,D-transpeptidase YcbB/YkuD
MVAAEEPTATLWEIDPLLELRVNIPAYRLDAIVGDEVLASFPVTVGAAYQPTPDGLFEIDRVIWNPWWHPPAHRRPKDKVTPPGPRNPMGRVKLHFAADLYFVHGTAKVGDIGQAVSRGCIRLANEDAIALAALVHDLAGPGLDEAELARLMRESSRTKTLTLDRPVPLRIVYDVVEIADGAIAVHEDVYRRFGGASTAELVASAVLAAGMAPESLRLGALALTLDEEPGAPVVLGDYVADEPRSGVPLTTSLALAASPGGSP